MCVSDIDHAYVAWTKQTAPCESIKDRKDRARWYEMVLMGLFREIKMKKTTSCGSIKDEKDRARWCETVLMGLFSEIRTKRPRHVDLRTKKTAPRGFIKDSKRPRHMV